MPVSQGAELVRVSSTETDAQLKEARSRIGNEVGRLVSENAINLNPVYQELVKQYSELEAQRVAVGAKIHGLSQALAAGEAARIPTAALVHSPGLPPLGGALCQRCPGPPAARAGISADALKLLKAYQRMDAEGLAELRLPEAVEREVEASMREFLRYSLERDPRSLAFLDEVRAPRVVPAAT